MPVKEADKPYHVIHTSTVTGQLKPTEARLNEGAVDPAGRFLAGTMGQTIGTFDGRMFSLRISADGWEAPLVLDNITCTNGMAWVDGGKKMYFTDSWVKEITTYDYDLSKGTMSNRQVFNDLNTPEYGYPDGLCTDDEGGVWTARWGAGKVLRLNPVTADVDIEIDIPSAWNVTCCIFGGGFLIKRSGLTKQARTSRTFTSPPPDATRGVGTRRIGRSWASCTLSVAWDTAGLSATASRAPSRPC